MIVKELIVELLEMPMGSEVIFKSEERDEIVITGVGQKGNFLSVLEFQERVYTTEPKDE